METSRKPGTGGTEPADALSAQAKLAGWGINVLASQVFPPGGKVRRLHFCRPHDVACH